MNDVVNLEQLKHDLLGLEDLSDHVLQDRIEGQDWPEQALTMIGLRRLNNFQQIIESVVRENVSGDVIECGVWRGGACIYASAVLESLQSEKKIYVADSFCGFQKPKNHIDKMATFIDEPYLKVSLEEVQQNFKKYNLLNNQVIFVSGYFEQTLPNLQAQFSVIRADADLFEPTAEILTYLYPKLSIGGYIIIDDYAIDACRWAVEAYRQKCHITEQVYMIDQSGIYWRKERM